MEYIEKPNVAMLRAITATPMFRKMKAYAFALALMPWATMAHSGWYEVTNYVGTIGSANVHVSLQTFDYINHGEAAQWRVEGSYYYDAHRVPIPLKGQRQPDGRMVLCEAVAPRSNAEPFFVPEPSATRQVPCPISLSPSNDGVTGDWKDDKRTLPITLQQVGQLDNTRSTRLVGVVDIPMWYHTKTHLLLGVYQPAEDCAVSMLHLRLVNVRSGHIDQDLPLGCDAGMLMTSIYANVVSGPTDHQVTVRFQGGKMGYDVVVNIEERVARGK